MNRFFILLFSLGVPLSAFAQTAPTSVAQEIIVTASALPEDLDAAPAAVTLITRKEIEEREATDVADVLREVPGLTLSRSGSRGKATSLFTRGGNSQHTLVMWNGIEINNPYFSGYDWGRFSTAGVEQVEVVRGPYSALYGSDAVAGVVNVLTVPRSTGLELRAQAGERGLFEGSIDGRWRSSFLGINASFDDRNDDGWFANDDFAQQSATAGADWKAPSWSAAIQGRFTSYDLGIPFNTSADGTELVPSPERRQEGSELQFVIPLSLDLRGVRYELNVSESRRDDTFRDPEDPFGFTSAATDSVTRRAHALARTATPIGTIIVGGEYETAEVDDVSSFGTNLEASNRTSRSLFIEDRLGKDLGSGSFEMSAGVRYDEFDTFGSEVSPRLGLAFRVGSNKVRAAYGEGFRAPSVGELYFPFSGNRDLEPERSRSFEVGYDRSLSSSGRLSATLFSSEFDNLIVFDNASFTFENIGQASTRGVELGASATVLPALTAALSYTWLDTGQEDTGQPLLRRPRHSGSLSAHYKRGWMSGGAVILYTGERPDVQSVAPYSRVISSSWATLDVHAGVELGKLHPYVKIENTLDREYEDVSGYPAPGRRALIGFRYSIQ